MKRAASTVLVSQDHETPVQVIEDGNFLCRFAYARSADSRAAGEDGQDFLALRHDDRSFVFALCDGVTLSFYGELAARILGEALIEWLWSGLPQCGSPENVLPALNRLLKDLTVPATATVDMHRLPDGIPALLRDVLEQKRRYGSEATFACGRIDLPDPDNPGGRVMLAWHGDSRLRIWGPGGELDLLPVEAFGSTNRWSSRRGAVGGNPFVFAGPLHDGTHAAITRIVAYSDGISILDRFTEPPTNAALQELIDLLDESPTSDDISFIEMLPGGSRRAGRTGRRTSLGVG